MTFKPRDYILDIAHAHCDTVREALHRLVKPEGGGSSYWLVRPMGDDRFTRGIKTYVSVTPGRTLRLTAAQVKVILGRL